MLAQELYEKAKELNNKINDYIKNGKINFNYQLMNSLKNIENQLKKEFNKENENSFDFLVIIKKEKLISLYIKEFISELDPEIDYIPSKEEIINDINEISSFESKYYVLIGEVYNMYSRVELDFNLFWNFDNMKIPGEIFDINRQDQLIIKSKILQEYNIQKIFLIN